MIRGVLKGGVALSEEKESFLRFTLEESVWFQKGQEVTQLLNISLDPDITIYENNGYISIDGALELSGEYVREQTEVYDDEFLSSHKFIQTVEHRDNNISVFTHRFPVDITIPLHRVKSLEEIEVIVDTFDYSFPERSCLKITADLMITGLNDENQQGVPSTPTFQTITTLAAQEEHREEEVKNEQSFTEEIPVQIEGEREGDIVEVVVNEEKREEEIVEVVANEDKREEKTEEETDQNIYTPFTVVGRYEPDKEEEEKEVIQKIETPPVLVRQHSIEETDESETLNQPLREPLYRYEEEKQWEEVEHFEQEEEVEEVEDSLTEEEVEEEVEEEKKKKKKISKKQGISITEFLARKEEKEELTRLRICIVQQGDTLETIADRYDVPILQLIKVNQLDVNEEIAEGQLLYIPSTVSSR